MVNENPLHGLEAQGQSVWLDLLSRDLLDSGAFRRLIDEDGLSGATANPSIFEKAIAHSHDYDADIRRLAGQSQDPKWIYEALAVEDVGRAADLLRPVYDRTQGRDGFASLEVAPGLAHDTAGTVREARRLWQALARPNVLIKVPATRAGLPAIRQLIAEGINVNVTLLFGLPRYREVADAYLSGLEERAGRGEPISGVASVASFFLSRIDVLVDPLLEEMMENTSSGLGKVAQEAYGETAIACAKVAYEIYREIFSGERFRALAGKGAQTQRLLWASTGTKNPAFSDVKYVETLIGPETINTMPLETLEAYRDHGRPPTGGVPLTQQVARGHQVLEDLGELSIDIEQVSEQLEAEGVRKFEDAFNNLLASIQKVASAGGEANQPQETRTARPRRQERREPAVHEATDRG